MMETFIVLGLCFILYEALDFFQGCMHSTQPATSDRIESYRRQITEEKLRSLQPTSTESSVSASPIIGGGTNPTGNGIDTIPSSPKSARFPRFPESSIDQRYRSYEQHYQQQQQQRHQQSISSSSTSLPHQHRLNSQGSNSGKTGATAVETGAAFQLSNNTSTTNFSSLPRDYYYLQQQKHKNSTKFLSKFSSSLSDNRIFPEVCSVPGPVVTGTGGTFDIIPPAAAAAPLVLDLKRAIFSGNKATSLQERRCRRFDNEEYLSSSDNPDDDDADEDDYSCSSDGEEPVKRIFSISEKI